MPNRKDTIFKGRKAFASLFLIFIISSAEITKLKEIFKVINLALNFIDEQRGFPGGFHGEESACDAGDPVQSLGQEDPLEKGTATHSSILAWRIPWTVEPGGLHAFHAVAKSQTRLSNQLTQSETWASLVLSGKESACQCRKCGFNLWVRKIPWKRRW